MNSKHIVNIGYPRSGTTWLWNHAKFEPRLDKENTILTTTLDFNQYISYYNQHQISANFQTNLWCIDKEIIKFVQKQATHITLIVRNPFDFVERYFDWIHKSQPIDTLTDYIIYSGFINYRDIVDRWSPGSSKFKIFFFDDLKTDPEKFLSQYLMFCDLPVVKSKQINYTKEINANPKQNKIKLNFNHNQIKFINNEIDRFQVVVDRDLSHWKR